MGENSPTENVMSIWTASVSGSLLLGLKPKHKLIIYELGKLANGVKPQISSLGDISRSDLRVKHHFNFTTKAVFLNRSEFVLVFISRKLDNCNSISGAAYSELPRYTQLYD